MTSATPKPAVSDYLVSQDWPGYSTAEHATWKTLFERQQRLLRGRACAEFLAGIHALDVTATGIPDFRRLNEILKAASGWEIVAVAGLVPDDVFFALLADRKFPAARFIRTPAQLDYIQEPDVFHDVFGHVPMLVHPVFGDYMQAYGAGGLKALGLGALENLARLYWYTVEFGLIRTPEGLRIYGSGIVSSRGESIYALEDPKPARLRFDLKRIMRTRYRIDDFQECYFVIDSFEELIAATRPDFTPYYREIAALPAIQPGQLVEGDRLL